MKNLIIIQLIFFCQMMSARADELLARCYAQIPSYQIDIVRNDHGKLELLERVSLFSEARKILDTTFEVFFREDLSVPHSPSLRVIGHKKVSSCFPKTCFPNRVKFVSVTIHSSMFPVHLDPREDNFLDSYMGFQQRRLDLIFCELDKGQGLFKTN